MSPDNFSTDPTPTQVLAARIDGLEAELHSAYGQKRRSENERHGLHCALKDCLRDLELALPHLKANYPDGKVTAQIQSRIEVVGLLLANKGSAT